MLCRGTIDPCVSAGLIAPKTGPETGAIGAAEGRGTRLAGMSELEGAIKSRSLNRNGRRSAAKIGSSFISAGL